MTVVARCDVCGDLTVSLDGVCVSDHHLVTYRGDMVVLGVGRRPMPFQRTRILKGRPIQDQAYRAWKQAAALELRSQWVGSPVECAVWVDVTVHPDRADVVLSGSPLRYSVGVADGEAAQSGRKATAWRGGLRGDLDNYVKAVLDAMQDAGVIGDDRQVVGLAARFGQGAAAPAGPNHQTRPGAGDPRRTG